MQNLAFELSKQFEMNREKDVYRILSTLLF